MKVVLGCFVFLVSAAQTHAQDWLELVREDCPITVEASGTVVSKDELRFSVPPHSSWSTSIAALATEGARVKPGDLLVRFEGSRSESRLREYRGRVNVRRGELASIIAQHAQEVEADKLKLAEAKSAAERAQRKAEQPVDLIASVEYARLAEERRLAEALYEHLKRREPLSTYARETKRKSLEAAIKRYESRVETLVEEVRNFTIRAPRSGLVVIGENMNGEKLDINSGVNPGYVIVSLVDDTKLNIEAHIPEQKAARLEIGQPTRVIVDSAGGVELDGVVSMVDRSIRRKTRYSGLMVRRFEVDLKDASTALKLGHTVQVIVQVDLQSRALAVPRDALEYRAGQPGLQSEGGWVAVKLGEDSGERIIVTSGIDAGERVRL